MSSNVKYMQVVTRLLGIVLHCIKFATSVFSQDRFLPGIRAKIIPPRRVGPCPAMTSNYTCVYEVVYESVYSHLLFFAIHPHQLLPLSLYTSLLYTI